MIVAEMLPQGTFLSSWRSHISEWTRCSRPFPQDPSFLHIAVVLPRKLGKLAVPKRVEKPLLSLCAQKYGPTWMASPQDHQVTMDTETMGRMDAWANGCRGGDTVSPKNPPLTHTPRTHIC